MKQFDRTSESVQPHFVKSKVGKYSKVLSRLYIGPIACNISQKHQADQAMRATYIDMYTARIPSTAQCSLRMRNAVHRRHRHPTHGTIVLFRSTIPRVQGVSASQLWHAAQGCAGATQLPLAPFSSCEKPLLFLRRGHHFSTLCVCPEPVLTNKSFSRFITQSECIDRWHLDLCQTKALFVRCTWQPGISHSGPQ